MNINDKQRQEWVQKTLSVLPAGKILDAGAGELRNRQYCSQLEYVSQDFCQYDGKGDNKGLQNQVWDTSKIDIVSDIADIPVDDECFDYVVCTEVFEHIKYPVDALKEFNRILKPGGKLILTAPFCSLTHMAPYHIYSGFNQYFYSSVLPDCGYGNVLLAANGNYFQYLEQEIKRIGFMSKKYGNSKFSFLYKAMVVPTLLLYRMLGSKSEDTSELLCFGYNVTATKLVNK